MSNKIKYPCDADRHRGVLTRLWAGEVVRAYRAAKSRCIASVTPQFATPRENQPIMCKVTPPLLTSEERGKGDSINAKMHKLIGKYRDCT